MMRLKQLFGPSIPISEARVWRMAYTRAFYVYEIAFALIAALSHPYAPLHAAPIYVQIIFWTAGYAMFLPIYHFVHIVLLRGSLRFEIKTISETFLMALTLALLMPFSVLCFTVLGVAVTGVVPLLSLFVFCLVLFEIGAYGYLKYGDRALFPEIYAPADAPPEPERTYEVFLRGTTLPVASVEMIRALDKGIEVRGLNQTFTVKRSLQRTLSELPVNLGIQIHRTIWVSRHLARNHINEGGTLYVTTSDGKRFPVARSRRTEFLAWIRMMQG